MPIQQITVVPARESSGTGKSSSRSKDKSVGKKAPGRSGSRSSNISKVSNSTGLTTASRTSVTPSSQDICSSIPLSHLEEEETALANSGKQTDSSTMTVANALGSSGPSQKKQVKRRHRRKGTGCPPFDCVDSNSKQDQTDRSLSSGRSEGGGKRERLSRPKRDLPPRSLRSSSAPQSDSSSDEDDWRQARSWSKEKARRARRRSTSSRDRELNTVRAYENKTEMMELESISSEDENENENPLPEENSPKNSHGSRASVKQEPSEVETSASKDQEPQSPEGSSTPPTEEEQPGELITKRYQERGPGGGDMSVPTPQSHCTGNGTTTMLPYSDSETEVCRICHCEGDDECPLITPCRCTGSLSFVHQTCLNQWIKSSDTRCCELCKFDFIMETKLKPLNKWEKLHLSKSERRKIFCSVLFHIIAICCLLWSVYILVMRTAEEVRLGKNDELWRVSLLKYYTPQGVLEWPFWSKLIVVAIGFAGGLIFMYIQSKVYLQLWQRLKAFNRIITVQNCPDKELHNPLARRSQNSSHSVEVPASPAPGSTHDHRESDMTVEPAVTPEHSPV